MSLKDLASLYEKHTHGQARYKPIDYIYSNDYNLDTKSSKQNIPNHHYEKKSSDSSLRKQAYLKTALSSENINELNKRNNSSSNKQQIPIFVHHASKNIFENKTKIKELHVGAKEKSTKKFVEASQKLKENSNSINSHSGSKSSVGSGSQSTINKQKTNVYDKSYYSNYNIKKPPNVYSRYYQNNAEQNENKKEKFYQSHAQNNIERKKSDDNVLKAVNVKQKETRKVKNSQPVFKPPNTEELMKPTLRGPPAGLFQNFSDQSLKYMPTIEVGAQIKSNLEIKPQKSTSGHGHISKPNNNELRVKQKLIEKIINTSQNIEKENKKQRDQKPLSNGEIEDPNTISPMVHKENSNWANDGINNNKFIIREKCKTKKTSSSHNDVSKESSTSSARLGKDQQQGMYNKVRLGETAPVKSLNKNCYNIKNVYKPPAPVIFQSNLHKKERNSSIQNISKQVSNHEHFLLKSASNNSKVEQFVNKNTNEV